MAVRTTRRAAPGGRVAGILLPTALAAAVSSGSALVLVLSGSVTVGRLDPPARPVGVAVERFSGVRVPVAVDVPGPARTARTGRVAGSGTEPNTEPIVAAPPAGTGTQVAPAAQVGRAASGAARPGAGSAGPDGGPDGGADPDTDGPSGDDDGSGHGGSGHGGSGDDGSGHNGSGDDDSEHRCPGPGHPQPGPGHPQPGAGPGAPRDRRHRDAPARTRRDQAGGPRRDLPPSGCA